MIDGLTLLLVLAVLGLAAHDCLRSPEGDDPNQIGDQP